jgi:hypothetical protein
LIPIISKFLPSVVAADGTRFEKRAPSALGKPVDSASSSLAGKNQPTEFKLNLAPLPTLMRGKIRGPAIQAVWALSLLWGALNLPQSLRDVIARAYKPPST